MPRPLPEAIRLFLDGSPHAVVGASRDRSKYGNKVLRAYLQNGRPVHPVNPAGGEVEGLLAYPSLAALPEPVHGVSVVTPPRITEKVVARALDLGVEHIWLQPGAESEEAMRLARAAGANLLAAGPCILVALRYREE